MCHEFKTCGEVIKLRTILVCWVSGSTPKEEAAIFQSDEPTPNRHEIKPELQPGYSYSNGIRTATHTANRSKVCQTCTYLQQITSHMIPWYRQHSYICIHIHVAVHRNIVMDIQCIHTYIAMELSIGHVHVYVCTWIYWEAQLPRPWMTLKSKCSTKSPNAQDVFRSIPGLISYVCWGDWECGHYSGLHTKSVHNVHVLEQHHRTDVYVL